MKLQTLKELIEIEFDRCKTISQFKNEVFRLLEIYDRDMLNNVILPIPPKPDRLEEKIKQAEWASK